MSDDIAAPEGKPTVPQARWFMVGVVAVCAAVLALLYGSAIGIALVGDDWSLILKASSGLGYIVTTFAASYHYLPLPEVALLAVFSVAGLDVLAYHLVTMALAVVVAALVAAIGWKITGSRLVALLAGVLFIAYGTHYEAIIWTTVSFYYTISTAIYLVGFLCYLQWASGEGRARRISYGVFCACIVAGLLAHEQTITLIVACALYRLLVLETRVPRTAREVGLLVRGWAVDFALPLVLVVLFLVFKAWLAQSTGAPQAPGLAQPWESRLLLWGYALYQAVLPGTGSIAAYPWAAALQGGDLWRLASPAVVVLLVALVGPRVHRFLALWTILLVVTITAAAGGIASRHFFLIAVPASLLWASLVVWAAALLRRALTRAGLRPRTAGALGALPAVAVAGVLLFSGARYAVAHTEAWVDASRRTDELFGQIVAMTAQAPAGGRVYLIDLPAFAPTPGGDVAYMFFNSPEYAAVLLMPGRFREVLPVHGADITSGWGSNVPASIEQLEEHAQEPGTLLLKYDGVTRSLRPWVMPRERAFPTRQAVETVNGIAADPGRPISLGAGEMLAIEGWAVDDEAGGPAGDVIVSVDGLGSFYARTGIDRPDVAQRLGDDAYGRSGFLARFAGGMLPPGPHTVSIGIVSRDGRSVTPVDDAVEIEVMAP